MNTSTIEKVNPSNWVTIIFLSATPVFTVVFLIYFFMTMHFEWWMGALFAFFYTATAGSITTGYHRYWAHRTYETNTVVRWFLALFGAAAFQSSILTWATDHRIHHRFVDTNDDPYSINKGFWFAHILWMFTLPPPHPMAKAYQRDLLNDPIVVFQDRHYVPIAIFMCFLLPMGIGWLCGSAFAGLLFGGLLRLVMVHHFTFFINSACHYFGTQRYTDTNSARDNWLLALFTYGEGYHNYHHYFANDYRNGIRWYQWDPTKWTIEILHFFGFAYDLKRVPEHEILSARLAMDEKRLLNEVSPSEFLKETLQKLKSRVEQAQIRIHELQAEYQQFRNQRQDQYRQKVAQLKRDLDQARAEFRHALQVWQASLRNARKASVIIAP